MRLRAEAMEWRAVLRALSAAIGFLLLFFLIHLPHGPEHWSADLRTLFLSKRLDKQHDRIALIEITPATLTSYPYVSPIDRKLMADLIRTVDTAEPKAIGLDIILDRATEQWKDEELLKAVRDARAPIVLGALDDGLASEPGRRFQSDFLERAKRPVGHLYLGERHDNPLIIEEHVIRLMAESPTQRNRPSFAEKLAELDGPHRVDQGKEISWLLPPKKEGAETFLTLPAEQLLSPRQIGLPIKTLLQDRFVLIGGNFPDRDLHLTPLSVLNDERFSGLFIHAQILAQLLADEHIYVLQSWPLYYVLWAIFAGLGAWTGMRQSGRDELVIELASVVALILISVIAFRYAKFIFPFVSVLLAWLAGVSGGRYFKGSHRKPSA